MTDAEVRVALPVNAELGEGLHWDARRQLLWMVDIHGQRLIQWDLQSSGWLEWPLPHRIGWVIHCADSDALLLGLQPGIARAILGAPGTEPSLSWITRPFGDNTALRLNDAKADVTGAIWCGSMNNDDPSHGEGCLFRLGPDGQLSVHDSGYNVANGPAISPDGRTLLHTDSGRRLIHAFDLDAQAGSVSNKRVWKQFRDDEGYPDGMTFDAAGRLWVAHWGPGCVSCFTAYGELVLRVQLPAPLITNVCFAAALGHRLFVSSARVGMKDGAQAQFPHAGCLFEIVVPGIVGAPGLPCFHR